MNKPKSETLFHFTKTLNVLKLILKNGFMPRFCFEDVEWMESQHKKLAYAMTCFCDIPLSRIGEHTSFYGDYGLGLTKEWKQRNSLLCPVLYFPNNSDNALKKLAIFLLDKFDTTDEKSLELTFELIKLMKPTQGKMKDASGKDTDKDFYQESEWRYVPPLDMLITEKDFNEDDLNQANDSAKEYPLKFTPSDVRYIFVQDDTEIPDLYDFINENMKDYDSNDIKILQTKIVSLKSIRVDL